MENYKLEQRLGKGAQGSVYLAVHRSEGTRYVLKKIECNDESEANKAFQEALALKKLKHPLVCGFKELFVEWDKEISAMFVCIVMEQYTKGDLSTLIRQKREQGELLDELVIKKWLGQILDVLVFIHSKDVIHRDLKPSNVFLQEDDSIAVGDFGIATVMSDVLTRTRSSVGTLNYMAPEVLERPHDQKTDTWSVGCILLELATCNESDPSETAGLLNKIKHDEAALEKVLTDVRNNHGNELASILEQMLNKNYAERCTPTDIVELPYIKECLQLSGLVLADKQKRERSARRSDRQIPRDKGIAAMVEYLTDNLGNESALKQAMEQLSTLTKDEGCGVDADGKRILVKAMRDYISERDIQIWGCQALTNLVMTATTDDPLFSPDVIAVVTRSMEEHLSCGNVQQAAANLLMALSADEKAIEAIGSLRGIENLLLTLKSHHSAAPVCTACLNALWSLAVNEDNVKTLTENKGIFDVVSAMKEHSNDPDLLEAACAVLLSLSIEDENINHINKLDCVGLVIDAIQTHIKEAKLVKNACMALSAMVEPDEESAFRVLTNMHDGQEVAGIPVIMAAYEQHKDNAEVVENICVLTMELLEYEEIMSDLKHMRIREKVLLEIHKRFKENKDIMRPCEAALSKLGSNLPLQHGPRA